MSDIDVSRLGERIAARFEEEALAEIAAAIERRDAGAPIYWDVDIRVAPPGGADWVRWRGSTIRLRQSQACDLCERVAPCECAGGPCACSCGRCMATEIPWAAWP